MAVTEPGSAGNPSHDHPFRNWRIAGGIFASITLLLGAIGLAGWLFNEPLWRSIWKTGSEMKFNTALCLTLLGAAFLLSFPRGTLARKASAWGAMVVVLLTALTLLEYGLSLNFGIDELVFKDTNLLGTTFPGRMAGQSAITFILLATGILLLRCESQRLRGAAQWVALVSLGFPTQALMGYALGRMTVVGLGPESSYMAIPTVMAFIAGALALLLREPDQFLMESLTARTQASAVFRRLLVCACLLPLMLGWLALNVVGGDQQSPQFSVATVALITTFIFVGLMWFNAARLNTVTQALSKGDQLLRASENRSRAEGQKFISFAAQSSEFIGMSDLELKPYYVNDAGLRLVGLDSLEAAGRTPIAEFFFPEDQAFIFQEFLPRLRRDGSARTEIRFRHFKTGAAVWMIFNVFHLKDGNDQPVGIATVSQDITERKLAEEKLRETQARLETTLAITDVATWTWDIPNDRVWADQRLARFFSVTEEDAAGGAIHKFFQAIHPEDRASVRAALDAAMQSEQGQYEMDYRLVQDDQRVRWVAARGQVERDAAGRPVRFPGVVIDITMRKQAEAMLRQNEGLFAALVEQAPTGVYVVDSQFRLQQVNARALPVFAAVTPLTGRDFTEVMHILWGPEVGDQLVKIFRHTLATGEPYISEPFSERRQDLDVEEAYEWETQRVTLPDGQHGVVCYFNNVTERHQTETSLLRAKTTAEAASRAKDDFLAALSHELRTPLNPALLIASESADNHQLPEEVRGNFEVILKSIELEARLIDDLLDLTRITSGKLTLNKTVVDVHTVLADALTTVRAEQQEKNIQLALKLAAETFWVNGDAVRLQQVFWNVLKNAVKFTPAGGRITVTTSRNASGQLAVSIADSGLGLSPDELGRVFSAFAQGDHAGGGGSHRFGGLGLGLAISKNLVELHAGVIRAESAGRDCGATFTIELPLTERNKESAPAIAPANLSPPDRSGIRILLVEDHEPTRTALAHLLVRRRYEVKAAASLAEARALAGQHQFQLLISDIGLPDGNGFELMTELRAGNPDLRGIALTGYGMEEDIARSQNAGFVSHLVKPVRVQSLEAALALALAAG